MRASWSKNLEITLPDFSKSLLHAKNTFAMKKIHCIRLPSKQNKHLKSFNPLLKLTSHLLNFKKIT